MGEFGRCIALFQAEVESPARAKESTGLRHVAFMVSAGTISTERRSICAAHGVEFRSEDHGNALSVYVADPDGNVVELTTYER